MSNNIYSQTRYANAIPVRVSWADGRTAYKWIPELNDREICKAFSLDEIRTKIDMNKTYTEHRFSEGVVFFEGQPIARLWIAKPSDCFRDLDPMSSNDFWNQNHLR
jgi:hypothetical protein